MSNDKTSDDYEVGYGKPPKNRQFQKGVSGNPRGRPKKALDFDHELLRESKSSVTITENGRRRRISKHNVAVKQLIKGAMTGNPQAQRTYFPLHQQALERAALSAGPQPMDPKKYDDVKKLTDEELESLLVSSLEKAEQESGKGHVSNTE